MVKVEKNKSKETNKVETFQVGHFDDNGYKIKSIIGKNKDFLVYITETGSLKWKLFNEEQTAHLFSISLANSNVSKVHVTVPVKQQNHAMWMIGYALFNSFHLDDNNKISESFKDVENFIETAREEHLHEKYIFTSLVLSLSMLTLLLIFLYVVYSDVFFGKQAIKEIKDIETKVLASLVAMVAGTFGAFVSILHRFRDIEINSFSASRYIMLRSLVRTLVGSIFGVVVFIAYEGKLIPGVVNSNPYSLYFFAFVSGFSERFIPDLIKRFESKNDEKKI